MKTIWISALLLLCACSRSESPHSASERILSLPKQRQKIAWLQKKLDAAEQGRAKAQAEIERLRDEVHEAQLSLIRRQLDQCEKLFLESPQKWAALFPDDLSSLFAEERQALHWIIQEGPSPAAFEAQTELDRILRMITAISERRELSSGV